MPAQNYWGTTKPPAGTPVDRGYSLAQGLLLAYTFAEANGGAAFDATGRGLGLALNASSTFAGQGLLSDSTADGAKVLLPSWAKIGYPITVGVRMILRGTPTNSAAFWGADYDGAAGSPFTAAMISTGGGSLDFQFQSNNAGSFVTFGGGTLASYVGSASTSLVFVLSSAGRFGYLNGALLASASAVNPPTYSTATLSAGMYPGTSRNSNCVVEMGFVSQAAWTPAMAGQWHVQPYAMFAAPSWRRYFAPSGGLIYPNALDGLGNRLRGAV